MKKVLVLLLIAALAVSLCACAINANPPEEGSGVVFETTLLDGTPVKSADVFGKNKITMINVWASWCGPCQGELPELERLSAELEALGCGLIGILDDSDTENGLAVAKGTVSALEITYPMLASNGDIRRQLPIQYYPTTFFVDSEGRLVGEPIIGAQVSAYLPAVKALLEKQ